MSEILCVGAKEAINICGLAQRPINNITMENSVIHAKKGVQARFAENISLKGVKIVSTENGQVLDFADETFGDGYKSAF